MDETPLKRDSLLSFPVDFPIKVMGRTKPEFAQAILAIVQKHADDFRADPVEMRASREGRYVSLTFVIRAKSRAQLDALYQELCDHPLVAMVL
jgi:putative lipoic acid-binding regulatory protein